MENSNEQFQGQTKKCPKCQEDIQLDAKKCKHCGADLRSWFVRHKIISIVGGIIIIMFVVTSNADKQSTEQLTERPPEETAKTAEQIAEQSMENTKQSTQPETEEVEKQPTETVEETVKQSTEVKWKVVKKAFIQNCVKAGASFEYCKCTFGIIKKNYTVKEVSQFEGTPDELSSKVVKKCAENWKIAKKNFMEGCEKAGASFEDCECIFGIIKENYTVKEFSQFKGVPPDELSSKFLKECGNE